MGLIGQPNLLERKSFHAVQMVRVSWLLNVKSILMEFGYPWNE